MHVILFLLAMFVPAVCFSQTLDIEKYEIRQEKAIIPLLIGIALVSVAVGIYTFLQMRKMQKKNQPKPNQLDGTIADEGASFCDIAGSPHVHANITDIWGKSTQAIKKKSGGFLGIGKTSQVTGYRYYAKFAAFIGNRIEKFLGINFDNRGWILKGESDPTPVLEVRSGNLFGENEGGVAGDIDIHIGTPNQEPNLEYQKYFPLVSGYPYQSYLLFRGYNFQDPFFGHTFTTPAFYLGNSGYMKEMLLWVKRIHVRNDGREQWYDEKAEIGENSAYSEITNSFIADGVKYTKGEMKAIQNEIESIVSTNCIGGEVGFHSQAISLPARNENQFTYLSNATKEKFGLNSLFGNIELKGTSYFRGWGNYHADYLDSNWSTVKDMRMHNAIQINPVGFSAIYLVECRSRTLQEQLSVKFISDQSRIVKTVYEDNFGANYVQGHYLTLFVADGDVATVSFDTLAGPVSGTSSIIRSYIGPPIVLREEFTSEKLPRGVDINPIHKIREILTDDTAMAKPEHDINDANFIKAASRIYNEMLGISWAIDEKSCIDAIEELCYHIEAGIRVNRQTGLYEMVLFRDDWFAEDEIHAIAESTIKDLSLEVMNSDDIVNQLNVTYYDRQRIKNSTFSVYENGSILTMGHANAESVEFPYFMNMRNAEIVANWKLKQFSTPAWSGSFTTGWKEARKWNRYDLIRLPWSSKWNGTILARIMKINLGNGVDNTVTIDFEEVIPYSGEMNTSIVVDNPVDAGPQPPQPNINSVFEAPYYLTVLRAGQTNTDLELSNNPDIGYVAAIAVKPQSNSLNALLYTDGGAGEFEQVSRLDYCDILQLDQPIAETTSSFVVTGSLTQPANSNNLILLNGELMGFVSFDDATKALTVKRGVLDTVPKKHSSGSLFVFDLPDVAFDSTQYSYGEIVEAQVLTTTPSGIQELSTGTAIEIQSRAIRPYPPANVKINGEYFPIEIETDLVITWVDRNRMQQTGGAPLSWFDNGVTIEPNTQTHLILSQLDENQIELATSNANVTGATNYTMPISSMQADTRFVKVTLKTVRDSYESLQSFEHVVELSQFFSAPYDLTVEFKND